MLSDTDYSFIMPSKNFCTPNVHAIQMWSNELWLSDWSGCNSLHV